MKKLLILFVALFAIQANAQLGSYYNGKYHSKSKGLEWKMKKPLGLTQKEADRPNIVQKWIKGTGTNAVAIMVMVKNAPELRDFSKREIASEFQNAMVQKEFKDEVVSGIFGSYGISSTKSTVKYYVLDNYPGIQMYMAGDIRRLDKKIRMYQVMTMVFIPEKGKALAVLLTSGSQAQLDKYMRQYTQAMNSIVIPHQYGN